MVTLNTAKLVKVVSTSPHYLIGGTPFCWKNLAVSCMDGVGGSPLEEGVPGAGNGRVVIGEEGEVEHGETGHGRAAGVMGKVQSHDCQ